MDPAAQETYRLADKVFDAIFRSVPSEVGFCQSTCLRQNVICVFVNQLACDKGLSQFMCRSAHPMR